MLTEAELSALGLSLRIATTGVICALPVALSAAHVLARTRFWGRPLLDAALHLPLILPPVVVGYLLLIIFSPSAPVGAWLADSLGISFIFSWTGAALAAGVVSFPFQLRAIRQGFEAMDMGQIQAARSLGAGRLDRFFSISLPALAPGLVAGLITAFAAALGEFGAIITFVSNIPGETRTLPLAIHTALQSPGGEAVAARLSLLAIAVAFLGLLAADQLSLRLRRLREGPDV